MPIEDFLFGTDLIKAFQALLAPQFTVFFQVITLLGSDYFLAGLAAVVYWCYDKRRGRLLTYILLLGTYVNFYLKLLIPSPRPPLELRLAETQETSHGFPSGHVQDSTTFWMALAVSFRKRIFSAMGVVLIFAVGLSRIYLGLHTPIQLVGGVAVGIAFVVVVLLVLKYVPYRKADFHFARHAMFAALTFLPWVAAYLAFGTVGDGGRVAGYLLGFAIGAIVENRFVRLNTSITNSRRMIRTVVGGGIGLGVLRFVSIAVQVTDPLLTLFGYSFLGLTIAAVIPAAFGAMERERF